ncbi:GNAT family N-acetyltransferase [Sphingomonas sp.]|uniref:GNAT family N-acetyltransferase n=1 Tax=Sphingomonas sp. TaxID=28214 RepID=UPI002BFF7435|nr:GNAT family N-acetyltransferase [Sphingomonas sp.]HWK35492.1 GNAT family N-acetyltransferase [Sphingomonas sp.]
MSEVVDNRDANRYELVEDGHKAVAAYVLRGDVITFTHTVVPQELQGRGIASRLIKAALDDVRARGLRVVAECPFVAAYIDKHAAERDLLA